MKTKKMKLLSLLFVLASVVAIKTSLNPVCVQAMEDDSKINSNEIPKNDASIQTGEDEYLIDKDELKNFKLYDNVVKTKNASTQTDKIHAKKINLHNNSSTQTDETYGSIDKNKLKNINLHNNIIKTKKKTKKKTKNDSVQTGKTYGFADIDTFKYVEFFTDDYFDELVKRSKDFYTEQKKDLEIHTEKTNISLNDVEYDIQLPNSNVEDKLKDSDEIIFRFKNNNATELKFQTTIKDIAENGALLLCEWIQSLSDEIKNSISFNNWTQNEKKDCRFVSTKLGNYIADSTGEIINPIINFYEDDEDGIAYENQYRHQYISNLIFSASTTDNKDSLSIHYFYEMTVDKERKLIYLGSFKYIQDFKITGNPTKKLYFDEDEALKSYLFRHGKINNYSNNNTYYDDTLKKLSVYKKDKIFVRDIDTKLTLKDALFLSEGAYDDFTDDEFKENDFTEKDFTYSFNPILPIFANVKFITKKGFEKLRNRTYKIYTTRTKDKRVRTRKNKGQDLIINIEDSYDNGRYIIKIPKYFPEIYRKYRTNDFSKIAFNFRKGDVIPFTFKTTINDIVESGAILLYKWIESLPNFIKEDIEFNNWTEDNKRNFEFISNKLGDYFENTMIHNGYGHISSNDLVFSVSKNDLNELKIHYFYRIDTGKECNLVYLGNCFYPFDPELTKEFYSPYENGNDNSKLENEEKEALNSYLFRCCTIYGYKPIDYGKYISDHESEEESESDNIYSRY